MIVNISRLLEVGPLNNAFLYIFLCEEYKTSRSHADVIMFIFLEASDYVFTTLQLPLSLDRIKH
jgi:hypothetical protein